MEFIIGGLIGFPAGIFFVCGVLDGLASVKGNEVDGFFVEYKKVVYRMVKIEEPTDDKN